MTTTAKDLDVFTSPEQWRDGYREAGLPAEVRDEFVELLTVDGVVVLFIPVRMLLPTSDARRTAEHCWWEKWPVPGRLPDMSTLIETTLTVSREQVRDARRNGDRLQGRSGHDA